MLMAQEYDRYWNTLLPVFIDRVSAIMKKTVTEAVKEFGITNAHAVYLIALKIQDGQTIVELSRFLDLDQANSNKALRVLKEKGFVYDDRVGEKTKKFHYFLTEEGSKVADIAMGKLESTLNSPLNDITREDQMVLRNILLKYLMNLDPELEKYMGSPFTNPFYTYLGFLPPKSYSEGPQVESRRVLDDREDQDQ